MKNKLIAALLSFSILHAAEDKINLSNANNDALGLFLSYVPAEHPLVSELTRTRNCNNNLYDRLIEAYLQNNKIYYIEEKDIQNIMQESFSISANSKINKQEYRKHIFEAFKRYIEKYPYARYLNAIENDTYDAFTTELNKELSIHNQYQDSNTIDHELDYMSEEDLVKTLDMLKMEKKIIDNLCKYASLPKKTFIKQIAENTNHGDAFYNNFLRSQPKKQKIFRILTTCIVFLYGLKSVPYTVENIFYLIVGCIFVFNIDNLGKMPLVTLRYVDTYSNNYLRNYSRIKEFLDETKLYIDTFCDKINIKINQFRKDRAA